MPLSRQTCKAFANSSTLSIVPAILISPSTTMLESVDLLSAIDGSATSVGSTGLSVMPIVKTDCQWRELPHDFPPYQTVYSFFSRGEKSGLWEKILAHLFEKSRRD